MQNFPSIAQWRNSKGFFHCHLTWRFTINPNDSNILELVEIRPQNEFFVYVLLVNKLASHAVSFD